MTHRSSAIPDLVGQSIDNGRLKFIANLGSGSNGVVVLAIDTTSDTANPVFYAVKCLAKAERHSRRYSLQRQEISNHMKVSAHPNVVTLHRVVEDSFFLFLIFDYCPGGDFFQFLSERRIAPGNDDLVKKLFLQILDAVEACHNASVFHRDIKPENILCNEDGTRLYLCDFGLSTKRAFSSAFGAGSSFYMSPECLGQDCTTTTYSTRANDIWALGVILTAMISGHNPWRRAIVADECYRAYMRDSDFLCKTLPISRSANNILQRIFTSDSSQRITLPYLRLLIMQTDTFYARNVINLRPRRRRPEVPIVRETENDVPVDQKLRSKGEMVFTNNFRRTGGDKKKSPSFQSFDICAVSRSHPTDASRESPSEAESDEPRTPELVPYDHLPEVPICPDTGGRHFGVSPIVTGRKSADVTTSPGFLRRMAVRLYIR